MAGICKTGKSEYAVPDGIARLLGRGFLLKTKIEMFKEELDILNAQLFEMTEDYRGDAKSCTVSAGGIEVRIRVREDVKIADPERLKLMLDDRFQYLVREKITYRPEPKLKELAGKDAEIAGCLEFSDPVLSVIYREQ